MVEATLEDNFCPLAHFAIQYIGKSLSFRSLFSITFIKFGPVAPNFCQMKLINRTKKLPFLGEKYHS